MAFLLGCKLDKIYIYPLGGVSKFKMDLNIRISYELLILIMGPVFQMFAYFILINLMPNYYEVITIYNYTILLFNLLPVYPLDGGKFLSLVLECFYPFRKSLIITIYFSYFVVVIISIFNVYSFTLNLLIIVIFLLYKITIERRKINYLYEKFLLERYLNRYNFKRGDIVSDINNFKRDRHHLLKLSDKYYLEKEILEKKYKKY